jgi:hypothetical protein
MAERQRLRPVEALLLLPEGGYVFMEYYDSPDRTVEIVRKTVRKGELEFHFYHTERANLPLSPWGKFLKERLGLVIHTTQMIRVLQLGKEDKLCDLSQENVALFTSLVPETLTNEQKVAEPDPDQSTQAYFDSRQQARLKSEAEALVKIVLRKYQLGQCEYRAFFGGSASEAHHLMAYIIEVDCGGLLLDTDLEKEGYGHVIVVRWSLVNKQ